MLRCAVCLSSISDVSQSSAPLGRSMFTMTPTSDHTLFIYGGLGVDGNTLSKSRQQTWSECDASTLISKCSRCTSPAASVKLTDSETVNSPQPQTWHNMTPKTCFYFVCSCFVSLYGPFCIYLRSYWSFIVFFFLSGGFCVFCCHLASVVVFFI